MENQVINEAETCMTTLKDRYQANNLQNPTDTFPHNKHKNGYNAWECEHWSTGQGKVSRGASGERIDSTEHRIIISWIKYTSIRFTYPQRYDVIFGGNSSGAERILKLQKTCLRVVLNLKNRASCK